MIEKLSTVSSWVIHSYAMSNLPFTKSLHRSFSIGGIPPEHFRLVQDDH